MADDLTAKILQDYPSFAFLLNDPEIGPLLLDAVDPNKGFDAATFQAKLLQTNWWKTSSASMRQWETLVATDPATAQQQKETYKAQLHQLAMQNGVNLPPAQLDDWANTFLGQGVATSDPRVVNALVATYYANPTFRTGDSGNIETITGQARQLADQYMVDLTPADYSYWAQRIARGEQTIQGFQDELKQLAADRYSSYADRINAGVTPTQIFGQQRNAIANELEVSPESIDLMHDPRWSKVLGVPTTDGKVRPMTYNEAIQLARSQDAWKSTKGAQQQGADLTTQLLQTFGELK